MTKKKILLVLIIFVGFSISACGTRAARTLEQGNQAFSKEAYQEAMLDYSDAMEQAPSLAEPIYNLANTLYRMQGFGEAGDFFSQATDLASGDLAEWGFFNQGNNFYQQQQMEQAIEAYKEALRLNPQDMDAKINLELALIQQQEQEKKQAQSEQEGEEQPEQQDQNGQGQEKEEQQSASEQQSAEQSQEIPQEEQQQGSQPAQPPEGLTEEQAHQLLAAIGQATQTLQEKLEEIYALMGLPLEKDW